MKIFLITLALLMAGVVFIAPPLIAFLPILLVGLFLMASPLIMNSLTRGSRSRDAEAGVGEELPTSSPTAR